MEFRYLEGEKFYSSRIEAELETRGYKSGTYKIVCDKNGQFNGISLGEDGLGDFIKAEDL